MLNFLRRPAVLFFAAMVLSSSVYGEEVDKSLEPPPVATKEINNIYRDMVVVQRKAKNKAKKFLLNTFGSFDFSDGPTTMYGLNINAGYALSDYWEIYANLVPVFVATERGIVKRVNSYTLIDGDKAQLTYSKPQAQYGVEVLWAPAYGKDSWGPYSIVRSDTFLKLGLGMIQFGSDSGMRFNAVVGKTFFLSNLFNIRLAGGGSYLQAVVGSTEQNKTKKFYFAGILEAGLIWYL